MTGPLPVPGGAGRVGDHGRRSRAAFVGRAFRFPVRVRAEPSGDGARLALVVVPEYLPASGAVAVRATVSPTDERGRSAGRSIPIQLTVLYSEVEGGGFEYQIQPASGATGGGTWAPSVVSEGQQGLGVYVGPGWGDLPSPAPLGGARDGTARPLPAVAGADPAALVAPAARLALAGAASGGAGPTGDAKALADALAAGRFTVAGFAAFDAARPLSPPAPTARSSSAPFVAVEEVGGADGFTYP